MKIEWATLCQEVKETPDGLELIAPGRDTAFVAYFPIRCDLVVVLCMSAQLHAKRETTIVELQVIVRGPDGRIVRHMVIDLPLEVTNPDLFPRGWDSSLLQPIPVEFEASNPGVYLLIFSLAEDESVVVPVVVRR